MDILEFLDNSTTSFEAVNTISGILDADGYKKLDEKNKYEINKGGKYYVTRNGSSIIAFNIGSKLDSPSLQICSSHTDCPTFKIKPGDLIYDDMYLKINTEVYGGALFYPWFDRPLSIAGRVIVKEDGKIKSISYNHKEPFCIIPSLAIHMNSKINEGYKFNQQIDLLPICGLEKMDLIKYLSSKINKEVLSYDLYLYPTQKAYYWGEHKEFISSFHIDNLECAYTTLQGFINNFNDNNINVYCCFDNEETGSLSRQGADSDFFESNLRRVLDCLNLDYYEMLARGMMLSCDNAHAVHPNHNEKADPKNRPQLNKGIVIKFNANQSYVTDGLSCAILKDLLDRNNVPNQYFTNRSDERGGSTLGNLSNRHSSIMAVDIGLAQLAMHSPLETAGSKDIDYMISGIKAFYKAHLKDYNLD